MFFIITFIGLYHYIKNNFFYFLIAFFFLITDGYQLIPEEIFLFPIKVYGKDYALVLSILIIIYDIISKRNKVFYSNKILFSIVLFYVYLIFSTILDLGWYNPSFVGYFLMFRINLFLLSYLWVNNISYIEFEKFFKFLIKLTIFQSILCLIQIPFGIKLLTQGGVSEFDYLGLRWFRYTNIPYFIIPIFLILLLKSNNKIKYKNIIVFLFLSVIILTLSRTLIIASFFIIFISIFFGNVKKRKGTIILFSFLFLLFAPIVGSRLISTTNDINAATNYAIDDYGNDSQDLTFTYRILHASERFIYISKNIKSIFFGIGFIHEKDFPENSFLLGHKDFENNYKLTQLEQDDISWSNMFLRYGIVGTLIYLFIFYAFLKYFFKNRQIEIASSSFLFLIFSFILTFSSGRFSQPDFFLIPLILYSYLQSKIKQNSY